MMSSILIVEDDITFGMMLKTWLGKKGFEVSSVSNIARARKHIESQNVDLILSDLRLPDHEGIDLLKWMNEQGMDIPLIIMTGYADIQSAVQAMKVINDNIANPELSVEMVAETVGISRVHLHRKLKELTNQSTRDLIRNLRLKQAASLLASKRQSINEVAALTGFTNVAYFSTAFKELYGMTPTAYMEQNAASASSDTE